jgi:hypothetical protein
LNAWGAATESVMGLRASATIVSIGTLSSYLKFIS